MLPGVALPFKRLQGYLAHEKLLPPRTLQKAYAEGPMVVPARLKFLMSGVPLYASRSGPAVQTTPGNTFDPELDPFLPSVLPRNLSSFLSLSLSLSLSPSLSLFLPLSLSLALSSSPMVTHAWMSRDEGGDYRVTSLIRNRQPPWTTIGP